MRKKYVRMITLHYIDDSPGLSCPIQSAEIMEYSSGTILYVLSQNGREHWINLSTVRNWATFDTIEIIGATS